MSDDTTVLVGLFVVGFLGVTVGLVGVVFRRRHEREHKTVRIVEGDRIRCKNCGRHFEDGEYILVDARNGRVAKHYVCDNPRLAPPGAPL